MSRDLKPEDRALIAATNELNRRRLSIDWSNPATIMDVAKSVLDAARDEGRRAPGDLEAAARRLLACCEQPRGGLSRQGGEERAAMDGLRAILERRAPGEGTQVGRDEAALPEAVGWGLLNPDTGRYRNALCQTREAAESIVSRRSDKYLTLEARPLYAAPPPPVTEVAGDVVRLVLAARAVAFHDEATTEELKELDAASEAFADRVPWEDEPSEAEEGR